MLGLHTYIHTYILDTGVVFWTVFIYSSGKCDTHISPQTLLCCWEVKCKKHANNVEDWEVVWDLPRMKILNKTSSVLAVLPLMCICSLRWLCFFKSVFSVLVTLKHWFKNSFNSQVAEGLCLIIREMVPNLNPSLSISTPKLRLKDPPCVWKLLMVFVESQSENRVPSIL